MKQKMRILTLSFLLVMQSFFSITPAAFAEDGGGNDGEVVIADEGNNDGNEADEGTGEGEQADPEENEEAIKENGNILPQLFNLTSTGKDLAATEMGIDLDSLRICVDGSCSSGTDFELALNPGDLNKNFEVRFDYALADGHGVEPGDYFTFKVPTTLFKLQNVTNQNSGAATTYSVNAADGTVTVTFRDTFIPGEPVVNGSFVASWQLADSVKTSSLEQKHHFEFAGPKIFTLKVANTGGSPITKRVAATPAHNATVVQWQVDVNTNTQDIAGATLTDTLAANIVPGSITVEELDVKIGGSVSVKGAAAGADYSLASGSFPITFNATSNKKAYRITYSTTITPEQREAAIQNGTSISNSATFNGTTRGANASVTFDMPIEKSAGVYTHSSNGGSIEWTVTVNKDRRNIASGVTVKDVLTVTGTSDDTKTMEFVNAAPNLVTISPTPKAGTQQVSIAPNGKTLTVSFEPSAGNETKTHTIMYKTTDAVVDKTYSVNNKAQLWYGMTATGDFAYETDTVTTPVSQSVLSKSNISATSSNIDYANKTIDWTINFNDSNYGDITNVVFTDTFQTGKYMKLYRNAFNVPTGFTLTLDAPQTDAGGEYTLTGFTLTAPSHTVSAPVLITYTTHFDPKLPTTGTSIDNTVGVTWTKGGTNYSNTATGKVSFNAHTEHNGAKSGSYNPEDKSIKWTLDVNYNLYELTNPRIVDTFGKKQTMSQDDLNAIEVHTLNMSATPTVKDQVQKSAYNVVGTGQTADGLFTGFTLTFNDGTYTDAYRIVYTTKYRNEYIGELDGTGVNAGKQAKNSAILFSNNTQLTTFDTDSLGKNVNITNAGQYFTKNGRDITNTDYLEWTFALNKSQSWIQAGSTITDTLNDGQVLVEDFTGLSLSGINTPRGTFEVKKRNYTGTTSSLDLLTQPAIDALFNIEIDSDKKGFTLTFLQDINHEYEISYVTNIEDSVLSSLSNTYTYNFSGQEVRTDTKTVSESVSYQFIGGTSDLRTYNIKLTKEDGVSAVPLEGIEFELYNNNDVLVQEGSTDSDGKLDFNGIKYGTYTLKEVATLPGYSTDFQVNGVGSYAVEYVIQTAGSNTNLSYTLTNKKVCPQFELTVEYEGAPVQPGVEIVITDQTGTTEVTRAKTNQDGKINFADVDLPKGQYKVYDSKGNELGNINVLYLEGDCQATVTWPANTMSCPTFTLTIKENGVAVGKNMKITLQDIADDTAQPIVAYTDSDGKIVYDKADIPTGEYDVYDIQGNSLGTITVYDNILCEDEIDLAAGIIDACPLFELTVQDRRSNPQVNTPITVKDSNGQVVEGVNSQTILITDGDGKVTFPYVIEKGRYRVYDENDKLIGSFYVSNTCDAIVKPSSGGGGGGTPPEPEEPIDPNKPIDPEDPNKPIDTNKPVDPNNPTKPVDPNNPNQPGKVGSGGDKNDPQGNKGSNVLGGSDSNSKGNGKDSLLGSGQKLPQTGEERNLNLLISGILAIVLGALLIGFRRKTKES